MVFTFSLSAIVLPAVNQYWSILHYDALFSTVANDWITHQTYDTSTLLIVKYCFWPFPLVPFFWYSCLCIISFSIKSVHRKSEIYTWLQLIDYGGKQKTPNESKTKVNLHFHWVGFTSGMNKAFTGTWTFIFLIW